MAINTLAFNSKLTGELDKALVQESKTGFLADNNMRAKFVGARNVLIPELDMQGLGDYDRDNGFANGTLTLSNTPYTLSQDRGRQFQIDREDEDETGVANLAGQVLGEFVRTKVAPEMDAYVLSKLAAAAVAQSNTITGTPASQAYTMLNKAINSVQEAVGYSTNEPLVAFVNASFWADLMGTDEITRMLTVGDFKKGEVSTKVKMLNEVPVIPVSDGRMKTSFTFYDGVTDNSGSSGANEKPGGFVPASGAKSIGFLVLPKRAASLVKKSETIRTFSPDQNQKADAYLFQYRLYYDLFVRNAYKDSIYLYQY